MVGASGYASEQLGRWAGVVAHQRERPDERTSLA
jgi:hypothetical protein